MSNRNERPRAAWILPCALPPPVLVSQPLGALIASRLFTQELAR
jgi:hypothetical protein